MTGGADVDALFYLADARARRGDSTATPLLLLAVDAEPDSRRAPLYTAGVYAKLGHCEFAATFLSCAERRSGTSKQEQADLKMTRQLIDECSASEAR